MLGRKVRFKFSITYYLVIFYDKFYLSSIYFLPDTMSVISDISLNLLLPTMQWNSYNYPISQIRDLGSRDVMQYSSGNVSGK